MEMNRWIIPGLARLINLRELGRSSDEKLRKVTPREKGHLPSLGLHSIIVLLYFARRIAGRRKRLPLHRALARLTACRERCGLPYTCPVLDLPSLGLAGHAYKAQVRLPRAGQFLLLLFSLPSLPFLPRLLATSPGSSRILTSQWGNRAIVQLRRAAPSFLVPSRPADVSSDQYPMTPHALHDSCFSHARNNAPRWSFSHFSVRPPPAHCTDVLIANQIRAGVPEAPVCWGPEELHPLLREIRDITPRPRIIC
ncbi:hypothetical protein VTO42DRAFT_3285 [Malbranchea cinnamomea]